MLFLCAFINKTETHTHWILNVLSKHVILEMFNREAAIEAQREAAKKVRRKKKRTASSTSLASNTFHELYRLTGEVLGQGAYASVQTCVNIYTEMEYAVKIIEKVPTHSRSRVFKEIDLFHHCQVTTSLVFSPVSYQPSVTCRVIRTSSTWSSISRRRRGFTSYLRRC